MRQISGTLRGDWPPQLCSHTDIEHARAGGVRVAVLPHTNTRGLADRLLQAYQRGGAQAVHERRMDCGAVVLDDDSRTVVLTRDFVGTTPWYYAGDGRDFAFGTRISDVLAARSSAAAPNRAALAALLVAHAAAPIGDTYFENVHSLPPGATLIWRNGTPTLLAAHDSADRQPAPASYREAVERFGELLRNAVASRLDAAQPTAVLVSGGLDSSALICLAARAGDVFGITYGPSDDPAADESRYIEVLRAHGVRIERVPFYPIVDAVAVEQSIRELEAPTGDIVPLTLQRAKQAARAGGARTLLLGTWGDQVLAPFPPPQLARLSPWRAAALAARYREYMTDVGLREIQTALVRQSLRARAPAWLLRARQSRRRRASMFDLLAHDFVHAAGLTPTSFGAAVDANVRAPAQVQAIEATTKWGLSDQLDTRLPFLDRELVWFLNSLPDDFAYHDHRLKPLLRDALTGVLPEAIRERRDKGDYTAVIQRHQLPMHTVLELLEELRRPVAHGLMTPRSAAKTLAQLRRDANIAGSQGDVMVLLSVDTWLRLFFQNRQ